MKNRPVLIALLLVLSVASFACAPEAPPAQGSAAQGGGGSGVCDPLTAVGRTLTKAKTLTAFSSQGDVSKLQDELDKAMTAAIVSADPALDLAVLESEVDNFMVFADRVRPGITIGGSASLLQGQIVSIAQEYREVAEAAGCPT